jgi:uncharacterized protein YcbX
MNVLTVNLVLNTLLFWVVARIYLVPRLPQLSARSVLLPILLLHSSRHLGLMFLAPGATYAGLPAEFAYPAAYGDLLTAFVAALAIAPVKGMRLVGVDEVELVARGAVGDRVFAVIGADDGLALTSRNPALVQVVPSYDAARGTLRLRFPGGREVEDAVDGGAAAVTHAYDGRELPGRVVDGALAAAVSEHLGKPVRLLALDPRTQGADDFPVSMMSTASLHALSRHLGSGTDGRRFRMTLTIDGVEPWEEHGWSGREVAVGEALLRVVDPVPRCVVTTRDPDDGRRDAPVLKALAQLRGKDDVTFGVWCEVLRPGTVRRGDAVSPSPPRRASRASART